MTWGPLVQFAETGRMAFPKRGRYRTEEETDEGVEETLRTAEEGANGKSL
jgi:hypothetical protein